MNTAATTSRTWRRLALAVCCTLAGALAACSTPPPNPNPRAGQPHRLAQVDLPRYMGHWYVIANIPYFGENGYVAGQAEWALRDDGKIADAYIGRKGGFDAPPTRRDFVDTVVPGSGNAHWRVRLFWPIDVDQLTLYVDPDYQYTVLGYPDKSLGWIFARTPDITDAKYQELLGKLDAQGYDTARLRRVPQRPDQLGKPGFHSPGDKD